MTTSPPSQPYQPSVAALLDLGEHRSVKRHQGKRWLDYPQEFGFTLEHAPELLRMAIDAELDRLPQENAAVWAPLHAWRAIAQLGWVEAVQPLCAKVNIDDDYRYQDFPACCWLIGLPALKPLGEIVRGETEITGFARNIAIEALAYCGRENPEMYPHCVRAIAEQLQQYQRQSPYFNALLINGLVDLNAVEQAEVIKAAFAAKRVDLNVLGDWDEVQVRLGLLPRSALIERQIQASQAPVVDFQAAANTAPATHPAPKQGFGFGKSDQANKSKKAGKSRKSGKKRKS